MKKPRVAILGVGNIGEFHAREFHEAGCDIVAFLTSSQESAYQKAKRLKELYGINAKPYWNLDDLLFQEELDAVSICTPASTHYDYMKRCLKEGLHVLCEKPFVQSFSGESLGKSKELLELGKKNGAIITLNTQLVSFLEAINENTGNVQSFSMYMEPEPGDEFHLMDEVIPHMNSFLIRLLGSDDISNIQFFRGANKFEIKFKYGKSEINYQIGSSSVRPRKLLFSINEKDYSREILHDGRKYEMYLAGDGERRKLEDPLKVSVRKFVSALKLEDNVLVSEEEILQNARIYNEIIQKYKAQ